jgi:hypothetical protein
VRLGELTRPGGLEGVQLPLAGYRRAVSSPRRRLRPPAPGVQTILRSGAFGVFRSLQRD